MRRNTTFLMVSLLASLVTALVLTMAIPEMATQAQTIPLPTAIGTEKGVEGPAETLSPEEEQQQKDAIATVAADLESRIIFDYPAAYLITQEAAATDKSFSQAVIVGMTGAQTFYTWDEFLAADNTRPFDIVIVHKSMADAVDREWAHQAHWNEVIFMGLNIPLYQLAEILGNPCFERPEQPIPDQWDWINSFSYSINLEDPQYYDLVKRTLLEECHSNVDTHGTMRSAGYNTTTMPVMKPSWVATIPKILIGYTRDHNKPNHQLNK